MRSNRCVLPCKPGGRELARGSSGDSGGGTGQRGHGEVVGQPELGGRWGVSAEKGVRYEELGAKKQFRHKEVRDLGMLG